MYKYFIFSCKYIINSGSIFEHHNILHTFQVLWLKSTIISLLRYIS